MKLTPERKAEFEKSIKNRGAGIKSMFFQALCVYKEKLEEGNVERANEIFTVLTDTFNACCDDIDVLQIRLLDME